MFFNEFRLLDLRLAEELDRVDRFVIVEASKTHSNRTKDLHLACLPKYRHPKITLVECGAEFTESPGFNEAFQRNVAMAHLDLRDEDVLICSDLDEVHNGRDIPRIAEATRNAGFIKLFMPLFYYKINLCFGGWANPFAVTGRYLRESGKTLTQLRHIKRGDPSVPVLETFGKHFGYLMGPEQIRSKIHSFMHREFDRPEFTDPVAIAGRIARWEDPFGREKRAFRVPVDHTYPETILKNQEDWKAFIL